MPLSLDCARRNTLNFDESLSHRITSHANTFFFAVPFTARIDSNLRPRVDFTTLFCVIFLFILCRLRCFIHVIVSFCVDVQRNASWIHRIEHNVLVFGCNFQTCSNSEILEGYEIIRIGSDKCLSTLSFVHVEFRELSTFSHSSFELQIRSHSHCVNESMSIELD